MSARIAGPAATRRARALVVDDDLGIRQALTELFDHAGFDVRSAESQATAIAAARARAVDVVLLDLRLGGQSGLELIPELKAVHPEVSIIVVTAVASIDTAVEAMQAGADNFVTKPINPGRLLALVRKGLEARDLRHSSARLGRLLARDAEEGAHFGSLLMQEVRRLADAVAPRATTVLLLGETGTGKGMLARYIHEKAARAVRPFVELNCAGLARELTESELFGHERGAFTGASGRKLGLIEAAQGGTLFLDEIGEMELAVQAKLLKVLENGRFRRVGGVTEVEVETRVIAASHRDLERDVAEGRFRADLYYRLNVFAISLPPLCDRREDVAPLGRRFLAEQRSGQTLSDEALAALEGYDWPGNVRELRNVMERAAILAPRGAAITAEHLPPLVPRAVPTGAADNGAVSLDDAERALIEVTLEAQGGNILAAARALGVSRGLLYRRIARYGIKH